MSIDEQADASNRRDFSPIPADQQSVLDSLEGQATEMRQLVEQVCNINSYTENVDGVAQVREIFAGHYQSIADEIHEPSLPTYEVVDRKGNVTQHPVAAALQVIKRPAASNRVFLCIHLDTVYEPTSEFQVCTEKTLGQLNGPGVIDAKGGAVIMLYALKAFERYARASNLGWEVVLNTDEEIGSPASQEFIKSRGATCNIGMLYEPALPDGTLVDQRKGSGNFSIIIRGNSVHSGRDFENGRNAIVAAAELSTKLHRMNECHDDVTINVARIDGGGPLNVVPDLAVVRVNVRVSHAGEQAWFEQEVAKLVAETDQREGFSCELHGAFFSPPKELDPKSALLKSNIESAAQSLSIDVGWRSTGGVSDGNKLSAIHLPNIDTLGARGDNMHNPAEYLILESLVERAKLSALILMRYASGEYSLD